MDELVSILAGEGVVLLADIRRFPGSKRNPHLSRESLAAELPARMIASEWWGEGLGGRRRSTVDPSRHPAWRNPAFRSYADYMDTTEFRVALTRLLGVAGEQPTAVMCAETLWWRCHRRIVSDAATLFGTPVVHLLGGGHRHAHRLNPAARAGPDGWPVYDVGAQGELL